MNAPHRVALATGTLEVQAREAAFPLEELCGFAARNNRKRGFLFLSKVLGKHWPARPSRMRDLHRFLASGLRLGPGPWLFVAMAETATGLGQGVFEAALEQHPRAKSLFLHSTRYRLDGHPYLGFQEHHCHAPDQYLYEPIRAEHRDLFETARELIVVDDEISTGSTLCNLVDAYRARNPRLERAHFTCITSFSGAASAERFGERLGLPVNCVAALHADFSFRPESGAFSDEAPPAVGDNTCAPGQIAEDCGRFGIHYALDIPRQDIERLTEGLAPRSRVLVLGTGEFMHVSFRIGLLLEEQGHAVAVQSTTRSPILIDADVCRRLVFGDNYGEGITNYLYNVDPGGFDRTIICHETPVEGLEGLMRALGGSCLTYRYPASPASPGASGTTSHQD